MDCWEILGIDPRSDKKTIKIAYAKALKNTRPDDDPEGFQALHSAYKEALQWEDYEYYDEEQPAVEAVEVIENDISTVADTEPPLLVNNTPDNLVEVVLQTPISADEIKEGVPHESTLSSLTLDIVEEEQEKTLSTEELQLLEDIRQQEAVLSDSWDSFRDQVRELVSDHAACNEIKNWSFLESMPAMRDLEFRKRTADSLFEMVAELNEESLKKKTLYFKRPVINYLNNLFGWDKRWQEYEYRYSIEMHEAVFPYLEESEKVVKGKKPKREVYYYRRIAAFAIDVLIFCVIGYVFYEAIAMLTISQSLDEEEANGLIWLSGSAWFIVYMLIIIPVQECSRHQATVGKRLMDLEVINSRGGKINFFHAVARSFVTLFCCAGFKFIVWINLIFSWLKGVLLQDALSRSYVVMKKK